MSDGFCSQSDQDAIKRVTDKMYVAALARSARRSGSYPYMNIAEDYKLPYWAVLSYADLTKRALMIRWSGINKAKFDAPTVTELAAERMVREYLPDSEEFLRFAHRVCNTMRDFLTLRGDI